MLNRIGLLGAFLLSTTVFAAPQLPPSEQRLDTIAFQLTAKKWVTTNTALLTVKMNATLNNADLVKTRADMMTRLGKIATGDWHVTRFDRSQDSSGLEKLAVDAQVRVPQANLTTVYDSAKAVSKPGATYEIASIDFTPGLEEIQAAKGALRKDLYQSVLKEVQLINQVYTKQQFTLNNLIFFDGNQPPQPRMAQSAGMMNTMVMQAPSVSVSNELMMTAVVQVAANRDRLTTN